MERKSKSKKEAPAPKEVKVTIADYIESQKELNAALRNLDDMTANRDYWHKMYLDCQKEFDIISASVKAIRAQQEQDKVIERLKDRIYAPMLALSEFGNVIKNSGITETPAAKKRRKTIHLICKNDVDGSELQFLERYTSSGIINDCNGEPCYPINELNGDLYFAHRFHVYKPKRKQKK